MKISLEFKKKSTKPTIQTLGRHNNNEWMNLKGMYVHFNWVGPDEVCSTSRIGVSSVKPWASSSFLDVVTGGRKKHCLPVKHSNSSAGHLHTPQLSNSHWKSTGTDNEDLLTAV